jgi:hypothetical protein
VVLYACTEESESDVGERKMRARARETQAWGISFCQQKIKNSKLSFYRSSSTSRDVPTHDSCPLASRLCPCLCLWQSSGSPWAASTQGRVTPGPRHRQLAPRGHHLPSPPGRHLLLLHYYRPNHHHHHQLLHLHHQLLLLHHHHYHRLPTCRPGRRRAETEGARGCERRRRRRPAW